MLGGISYNHDPILWLLGLGLKLHLAATGSGGHLGLRVVLGWRVDKALLLLSDVVLHVDDHRLVDGNGLVDRVILLTHPILTRLFKLSDFLIARVI